MLSDLFLITDPANYNIALNQLAGSSYANYLQSFPSLGVHYNDILDHATTARFRRWPARCSSAALRRRSMSGVSSTIRRGRPTATVEAGTLKAKRFTGLLGVDASVGNAAILGVSAGMVTNHTRDHQFGDNIDARRHAGGRLRGL